MKIKKLAVGFLTVALAVGGGTSAFAANGAGAESFAQPIAATACVAAVEADQELPEGTVFLEAVNLGDVTPFVSLIPKSENDGGERAAITTDAAELTDATLAEDLSIIHFDEAGNMDGIEAAKALPATAVQQK